MYQCQSTMKPKRLWPIIQRTFSAWSEHEAPRVGAALAFYTILSLAPLAVLVIAVVALAFGHSSAQDQILSQVQAMVGQDGANAIRTMIEHAQKPTSGIFASIIGSSLCCSELQAFLVNYGRLWKRCGT